MQNLIIVAHVLAAIAIIALILIQQGKGADMGASFGAGASQTLFGSRGSGNALTRATAILAALFFITSFGLALVAKKQAEQAGLVQMPAAAQAPAKTGTEDTAKPQQKAPAKPVDDMPSVPQNAAPASDMPAANGAKPAAGSDMPAPDSAAKPDQAPAKPAR